MPEMGIRWRIGVTGIGGLTRTSEPGNGLGTGPWLALIRNPKRLLGDNGEYGGARTTVPKPLGAPPAVAAKQELKNAVCLQFMMESGCQYEGDGKCPFKHLPVLDGILTDKLGKRFRTDAELEESRQKRIRQQQHQPQPYGGGDYSGSYSGSGYGAPRQEYRQHSPPRREGGGASYSRDRR